MQQRLMASPGQSLCAPSGQMASSASDGILGVHHGAHRESTIDLLYHRCRSAIKVTVLPMSGSDHFPLLAEVKQEYQASDHNPKAARL
jgi:endonuclease/exonuclease/phosphatase (EEP) superfamily protein YafD